MATRPYTAEQRAAADQSRRDVVEQLHQQLAESLGRLDNRAEWERYLAFARGFPQYSFGNQLLLMRAGATAVSGYRAWQAKGYQVRAGEKAIRILGPVTRRVPISDASGNPVVDENGRPRQRQEMIGVKAVPVWDISQTDGPPVPEAPRPVLLTGQAPDGLWDSLAEIVADLGYTLERGECGGANGLTNYATHIIRVRDDVDDAQSTKSLAHEIGHAMLEDPSQAPGLVDCRGVREVEAESIAYLVTQAHHLDSGQYTFNYVTGWASQAAGDLTAEQVVRATGQRVIDAVDRILAHTQPEPNLTEAALVALEAAVDRKLVAPRPGTEVPILTGAAHGRAATTWSTTPDRRVALGQ